MASLLNFPQETSVNLIPDSIMFNRDNTLDSGFEPLTVWDLGRTIVSPKGWVYTFLGNWIPSKSEMFIVAKKL